MAIQSNDSTLEVADGGREFFSGLTNVKVVAVNPTMVELNELGVNIKTEPAYSGTHGLEDWSKVSIWLANEDGNFKLDLFLKNKFKESKTGKFQWINNVGQSSWSLDAPVYDWFGKEGMRKAYDGETTLIDFTKAWANVSNGGNVYYDTMDKIAQGDVAEIKELVNALSSNQVRVLIGVKDAKYQGIYTGYFGRVKPQRDDLFIKNLNDEYTQFKNHEYNQDLQWGKHIQALSLVTPDTIAENADWTTNEEPAVDAPF
jgi:hypothetical protein|tara:strand:+ start:415 stop:1188 length:774 start_codon:yes stop_codon:yes gene_type:complete